MHYSDLPTVKVVTITPLTCGKITVMLCLVALLKTIQTT